MNARGLAILAVIGATCAGSLRGDDLVGNAYCKTPELSRGLAAAANDAEAATAVEALLKGIEELEKRRGCREQLAEAYVSLAVAHAWLPDTSDKSGLPPAQARRLVLTLLRGEFEHALQLDASTARKTMNRLAEVVPSGVLNEFENAVAAVERAKRLPWLVLAVGGYIAGPNRGLQQGVTLGPYFYVGHKLFESQFSVGLAEGLTTHGGTSAAIAAGLHYRSSSHFSLFGGYGVRVAVSDSTSARHGWVFGVDWALR